MQTCSEVQREVQNVPVPRCSRKASSIKPTQSILYCFLTLRLFETQHLSTFGAGYFTVVDAVSGTFSVDNTYEPNALQVTLFDKISPQSRSQPFEILSLISIWWYMENVFFVSVAIIMLNSPVLALRLVFYDKSTLVGLSLSSVRERVQTTRLLYLLTSMFGI